MSAVTTPPAGPRTDACTTLDDLAHEHFDRVVSNTVLPARIAHPRDHDHGPLTDRSRPVCANAGSTHCGRIKPMRSTRSAAGAASSSPPVPRPASRSVTSCRSSSRWSTAPTTPPCSCSRPRRSRRTSCARSASGWSPISSPPPTTATPRPTNAPGCARTRERAAHEPRDAAHGDPAVARPVGDVPPAIALRRHRRVAHVARGVREPRRARTASAPALVRALRLGAHVLLHQRHHRQPGRARVAAERRSGGGDRQRRLASGRTQVRGLAAPTRRRPYAGSGRRRTSRPQCSCSRFVADGTRRWRSPAAARAPSSSPTHARGALAESRSDGSTPAPAVAAYRAGYLADRAPRAGRRSWSGRARGRGGHERARARHRHRHPRRRRAERVPRNAVVDASAGRPGRTHQSAGRRRPRGRRRPTRPVVRRATRASC